MLNLKRKIILGMKALQFNWIKTSFFILYLIKSNFSNFSFLKDKNNINKIRIFLSNLTVSNENCYDPGARALSSAKITCHRRARRSSSSSVRSVYTSRSSLLGASRCESAASTRLRVSVLIKLSFFIEFSRAAKIATQIDFTAIISHSTETYCTRVSISHVDNIRFTGPQDEATYWRVVQLVPRRRSILAAFTRVQPKARNSPF